MLSETEMREMIRETLILHWGGNQTECSRDLDISGSALSNILSGKMKISDTVARKFGLRRVVMYEKL